MKKPLLCICLIMLWIGFAHAQTASYKVVFDMTSRDTVNQQSVIREIGLIMDSNPAAKLEVVVYGQGIDLVVKDRSAQQSAVQKLMASNKATFKVCAMTMKRTGIGQAQLLPGVVVVPDG